MNVDGRLCGRRGRPGIGRREFLRAGAVGGLLTVADLMPLRAEAPGGAARPARSVIMIVLPGGPSQIDTFDPKPDAPDEVRGEYKPIQTRVPGVQVCELLPRLAGLTDRLAIVRSVIEVDPGQHDVSQLMTGWLQNPLGRPAVGSVLSKLRPGPDRGIPPYVSLQSGAGEEPGVLGLTHGPLRPTPGTAELLRPLAAADRERLAERRALLEAFDRGPAILGPAGPEAFREQAFDLLTSGKVGQAFDLTREPDRVRERYGQAPQLLTALRLVRAGVGCVTVTLGASPANPKLAGLWDTHKSNFDILDELLPQTDRAVAALVEDLGAWGLDEEVLVLMWGEMGRTPKMNAQAGRDHWPRVMSCVLAGGGLKTGQVIGATDAHGAEAKARPYRVQNVLATVYHALGIDPAVRVTDRTGQPIHLLEHREPIRELV